jgi:hypothetical protein
MQLYIDKWCWGIISSDTDKVLGLNELIKYVLRCLYIEDDSRFIFLTEIKNVGKPETDIDV